MTTTEIQSLQEQFTIPGHVTISAGAGGLATVEVANAFATGSMTLAGAHVMSYRPRNHAAQDVFWMSPNSAHIVGKAMRGGIPVCWPWFAAHPTEPQTKPVHGFARTSLWTLAGTCVLSDTTTEIRMRLTDSPQTRQLWPFAFNLEMIVQFGERLSVTLCVRNPGDTSFIYTGALHTYFNVSDVNQISISGLEGTDYLDKTDAFARKHQAGALKITGWTDRIYLNTTSACVIHDPGFQRQIRVEKEGSHTTVVWNPAEKTVDFPDVGVGNEKHFICVETANADQEMITVQPGVEAQLTTHISVV